MKKNKNQKKVLLKKYRSPQERAKNPRSWAEACGYTRKNFKQWGKEGGRPRKYLTNAERQRAYRLRKKNKSQ